MERIFLQESLRDEVGFKTLSLLAIINRATAEGAYKYIQGRKLYEKESKLTNNDLLNCATTFNVERL